VGQFILFVTLGLAAGAVYSVLAASLASIYLATGVINFAQGSIALWAVWATAQLRENGVLMLPVGSVGLTGGKPMGTAAAVAIGAACGLAWAALAYLIIFRPLRRAPMLSQVVASVGLMLLIQALVTLRFNTESATTPPILTSATVTVAGTAINVSNLLLCLLAIIVAAALWAYFRFSRAGVATRAAAEDERGVRLMGYAPDRLAGLVWLLTGIASTVVPVLASPTVGLDSLSYMYYVIPALAAALLGRLTSIPVACAAGLLLGSFQSILLWLATKSFWPLWAQAGFGDAIPFVIVIVALFALGRGIPERGSATAVRMPQIRPPRLTPAGVAVAAAAATAAVLLTSGTWRFALVTSAVMALIALSLVVLTGFLGQISLAAMAFAGAAGFALSRLTTNLHVPFPLSILLAALIAAVTGAIFGLPALRIRGAQLAVVTLAAAIALQSFVFGNPKFTPFSGNLITKPNLFGLDLSVQQGRDLATIRFSVTVLVIVLLVMVAVARMLNGRTGRAFLAVRSNERAASSTGVDVASTKLFGFFLAAFIAGVGGCLIGYSRGQLSVGSFTATAGLELLCITCVGGIARISGAVIAGLIAPLGLFYTFLNTTLNVGQYYQLIAALALVVTVIFNPSGLADTGRQAGAWLRALRGRRAVGGERDGDGDLDRGAVEMVVP
jgi:branched-chain amino acid transport system permease protein